jgi:hypothetical protein
MQRRLVNLMLERIDLVEGGLKNTRLEHGQKLLPLALLAPDLVETFWRGNSRMP